MDNFIFCSRCGTKHTNDGDTKFCKKCGKNLLSLSDDTPPAPIKPAAPRYQPRPATVLGTRDDDGEEERIDRIQSISELGGISSLAVEITKFGKPPQEKLGEAMLNPIDPKTLPPPRPADPFTMKDFEKEAGAVEPTTRNRKSSTEISG